MQDLAKAVKGRSTHGRVTNFNAGPAALPLPVLERVREELLNYGGSGMSVMEMSHRSPEYERINAEAEARVRRVLGVPEDYAVLFLQGGASLQFSMVPMNLCVEGRPVDVLHTGLWTAKAIEELLKLAPHRLAWTGEPHRFARLAKPAEIRLNPEASYVHLCSNNTVYGTQWRAFPDTGKVPLVADMSSDIASRRVPVGSFGLIYAGAQKNLGPAGVTVVILRKALAERAGEKVPTLLQYRTHIKNKSLYNTPPAFAVYVTGLVLEWIEREGGLEAIERRNEEKAGILYGAIDSSGGYWRGPVAKEDRSRMNVVFRIREGDEGAEKEFARLAAEEGLSGLAGHRAAGGLRASIYNAQGLEAVRALADFMRDFEKKRG
jgi:phosphoserine aminotransferase